VKRFDTFEIDEKKFEAIKLGVVGLNAEFDEIILEYNNRLIGNKEYSFRFDEAPIAEIFGFLNDASYVRDF